MPCTCILESTAAAVVLQARATIVLHVGTCLVLLTHRRRSPTRHLPSRVLDNVYHRGQGRDTLPIHCRTTILQFPTPSRRPLLEAKGRSEVPSSAPFNKPKTPVEKILALGISLSFVRTTALPKPDFLSGRYRAFGLHVYISPADDLYFFRDVSQNKYESC